MTISENSFSWPLVGNRHICEYLAKIIVKEQVGGTYIFTGPDNLGKTSLAIHFARALLCEKKGKSIPCGECPSCRQFPTGEANSDQEAIRHGDFFLLKKMKDKKNIGVEQAREFIKRLSLSSFLNSYKIGVVKHAETMSEEAANALLKTLEEPKREVIIILVTAHPDRLPGTILSRSQILEFKPVAAGAIYDYLVKDKGLPRSRAKDISRLAQGRPALAIKFADNKEFYDKYLKRLKAFYDFFQSDLNSRLKSVDELLKDAKEEQEKVKLAGRMLDVWQGLVRDLFLCREGEKDLIQHEVIRAEIETLSRQLDPKKLLGLARLLEESRTLLRENVLSKQALTYVAINI